jgi:hypothetical protein
VSECNDTYVALGGGPPVRADMVNICGWVWCCGGEVGTWRVGLELGENIWRAEGFVPGKDFFVSTIPSWREHCPVIKFLVRRPVQGLPYSVRFIFAC